MGADAIEIWNEPNLGREWPEGQISGGNYTNLLRQASAAIKATNPGTIVISGALAPTGAEAAFPGPRASSLKAVSIGFSACR
jgi:arabinogalactan endo-1,4-beta-galactosidase